MPLTTPHKRARTARRKHPLYNCAYCNARFTDDNPQLTSTQAICYRCTQAEQLRRARDYHRERLALVDLILLAVATTISIAAYMLST